MIDGKAMHGVTCDCGVDGSNESSLAQTPGILTRSRLEAQAE